MANTVGEKELKTNYPVEEGLTAETQKQTGREMTLEAQEDSRIWNKDKRGIQNY